MMIYPCAFCAFPECNNPAYLVCCLCVRPICGSHTIRVSQACQFWQDYCVTCHEQEEQRRKQGQETEA